MSEIIPKRKTLSDVPRVWNPACSEFNLDAQTHEIFARLIEIPLRKAVAQLHHKNIRTTSSDVWAAVHLHEETNSTAHISLDTAYLNTANKLILQSLRNNGQIVGNDIVLQVSSTDSISSVREHFVGVVAHFQPQPNESFSDEDILDVYVATFGMTTEQCKLLLLPETELQEISAYKVLDLLKVHTLFEAQTESFIRDMQENLSVTTSDLLQFLNSEYPNANFKWDELFLPKQDIKVIHVFAKEKFNRINFQIHL
jgi:hypothetical protein